MWKHFQKFCNFSTESGSRFVSNLLSFPNSEEELLPSFCLGSGQGSATFMPRSLFICLCWVSVHRWFPTFRLRHVVGSQLLHMNSYLQHAGSVLTMLSLFCPGPTRVTPMDYNPPCFSTHGILKARILWVKFAMHSSQGIFQPGSNPCLFVSLIGKWVLYHQYLPGKSRSGTKPRPLPWAPSSATGPPGRPLMRSVLMPGHWLLFCHAKI